MRAQNRYTNLPRLPAFVFVVFCALVGCRGGGGNPTGSENPILTSMTISSQSTSLPLGNAEQFSANGHFNDGTSRDLTTTVAWTSSNPAIAKIDSSGSLSTIALGSTTIAAVSGSVTASLVITVGPPQLLSITITPSAGVLALKGQQQLAAIGTYTNGTQDITSSVTWSATNPLVVTVTPGGKVSAGAVGFSSVQASSSAVVGSAGIAVTSMPRYGYVATGNDDSISMYSIDAINGLLKENGYIYTGELSPTGVSPPYTICVTVDPSETFAYAVNDEFSSLTNTPPNITVYRIETSGQLVSVSRANLASPPHDCVVFEPSGRYAYVANGNVVNAYAFDVSSGLRDVVPGSPFRAGDGAEQLAMDPMGRFLYVTNNGLTTQASTIIAYQIDSTTGRLTALPPFPVSNFLNYIAIHPSGKFAYISYADGKTISAYSVDHKTGALNSIPGASSVSVGNNPGRVVFSPLGDKVYVSTTDKALITYNVDPLTGLLTQAGPAVATPATPLRLQIDTSGAFLYLKYEDSNVVSIFQINATGLPIFSRSVPSRQGTPGVVTIIGGERPVTSKPQFAYVANGASQNVLAFNVNANGSLAQFFQTAPGGQPIALAANPWSTQLFGLSQSGPFSLYGFEIFNDGSLSTAGGIDSGVASRYLVVDRSDRFWFTSDGITAQIRMFQGGAPVFPISKATSFISGALATDPTGRYLFALNPTNSSVSVYAIGAAAVSLTVEPASSVPVPTGTNPVSLTTDGIGNFLYVANQGSSSISAYSIDYSNSAALTAINGSPLSLNSPPVFLCGEPTGQFLYVADMSGTISTYKIDVKSGALSSAFSIRVGSVNAMSTNASGYLYAASLNSGVFVYTIDEDSGALTAVPGSPFPATDARAIVTKSTLQ